MVATKPVMAKRSTKHGGERHAHQGAEQKSRPKCRQAIRNSGTFIASTIIPTGQWVKRLRIIEMPVTPPATISLGNMKNWKPTA